MELILRSSEAQCYPVDTIWTTEAPFPARTGQARVRTGSRTAACTPLNNLKAGMQPIYPLKSWS